MKYFITKTYRTAFIIIGIGLSYILSFVQLSNNFVAWFLLAMSVILILTGCYTWTKLKNRHWAFMFWGLLAPIGLLGISLLEDKTTYIGD